jgi:hypothetical protein
VQNEDDFLDMLFQKSIFDRDISFANIWRREAEVALDEALDQVEDYSVRRIMHAVDWPAKGERKSVDVALEPSLTNGDAIEIDPVFIIVSVFEDDFLARFEPKILAVDDPAHRTVASVVDSNVQHTKPGWYRQEEW